MLYSDIGGYSRSGSGSGSGSFVCIEKTVRVVQCRACCPFLRLCSQVLFFFQTMIFAIMFSYVCYSNTRELSHWFPSAERMPSP
jgi:hypothetical protein